MMIILISLDKKILTHEEVRSPLGEVVRCFFPPFLLLHFLYRGLLSKQLLIEDIYFKTMLLGNQALSRLLIVTTAVYPHLVVKYD